MTATPHTTAGPPWLVPRTGYVHVPFCGHHCGYCDFAVAAGQDHLIELYLDALDAELRTLSEPRPVESLFIGGGTPTYLSAKQLARLLEMVNHWLPLRSAALSPSPLGGEGLGVRGESDLPHGAVPPHPRPLSPKGRGEEEYSARPEFSIESTPESLDEEKARVLAAHGVNRVSVGAQSFQPHLLHALDRRHGVDHIPRAVEAVRRHIRALSFDLIFAAPGQTLAEWDADLSAALRFGPDHLSTYGLTYEKGTPLWKERQRGRVVPVPEEAELGLYLHAVDRLHAAGFEHYEISNFARPGRRSRHNQRYWANEAYYGFGVGAARYVDGRRELNTRDTKLYIRKALSGESPTFQSERLGPRDRAFETMACQLRRCDGIARERFREQTGYELGALLAPRLAPLVAAGLLSDSGLSVALTRQGKCVADGVIEELMKANS